MESPESFSDELVSAIRLAEMPDCMDVFEPDAPDREKYCGTCDRYFLVADGTHQCVPCLVSSIPVRVDDPKDLAITAWFRAPIMHARTTGHVEIEV